MITEMKGQIFELCDVVRQTGFEVHRYFGPGHLEKVYENALANRLRKQSVRLEQQYPITVRDQDGTVVGNYVADLIVERSLIIEIKAARAICDEHIAQILGYLRSTEIEHGLLINFGAPKFFIRKYVM